MCIQIEETNIENFQQQQLYIYQLVAILCFAKYYIVIIILILMTTNSKRNIWGKPSFFFNYLFFFYASYKHLLIIVFDGKIFYKERHVLIEILEWERNARKKAGQGVTSENLKKNLTRMFFRIITDQCLPQEAIQKWHSQTHNIQNFNTINNKIRENQSD